MKRLKKILTVFVLAAFCLTLLPPPAFAARLEQTPLEKNTAVEKLLYGAEQEGSLIERTTKLEKDLFGLPGKEALMAKVERIYVYVRESSATTPSLAFKMSALEWSLTQSIVKGPLKNRLETLEKTVAGVTGNGPIDARVSRLMAITYSSAKLQTGAATVNKDTLIKIKMITPLDSKKNRVGDPVEFEVAEDIYAAGLLVLPKGSVGKGKLSKAEAAQNFGRDAKLEVNFESITAMDLTEVPTHLGEEAKKETLSLATAAGASMVGLILLGPIGLVGGVFVHGKNITVAPGTLLYIQTQNDADLVGMMVK